MASSQSSSDDSSGVDVAHFIDDEAEEGEEEDGELSEVVSSEEEGEGWVLEEAVEGHTRKKGDVVEGSGDEEMLSDNEEVQSGDEDEEVQTGDEDEEVQIGDEDEEVQTGDEDEEVQTGDEDEEVQTGDENEEVQTGDEDEEVKTGDEDEEVQTGDEDGSYRSEEATDESESDHTDRGSGQLRWKEGLEQKAKKSFELRKSDSVTLRRLIYEEPVVKETQGEDDVSLDEFGGLFTTARKKQSVSALHEDDRSLTNQLVSQDWTNPSAAAAVKRLFVTGEWEEGDAQRLLAEDEGTGDEEGDFEDLETGEKHVSKKGERTGEEEQISEQERLEKKKELKTHFDVEYDDVEGASYLDELKQAVSAQAELNRKEFEGLDDESRVMLEGLRPGTYVRMEIKGELCEALGGLLYPSARSEVCGTEKPLVHSFSKLEYTAVCVLCVSLALVREVHLTISFCCIQDHACLVTYPYIEGRHLLWE